jgi:5'/3'-nucleotidase SurE
LRWKSTDATILVTNDDGINSPGLLALKQAMAPVGEVIVLAPERNWSASSHAKTMHKPLRIHAGDTGRRLHKAMPPAAARPTAWRWSWAARSMSSPTWW